MHRIAIFLLIAFHLFPATFAYFKYPYLNFFSGYVFIWAIFLSFLIGISIAIYSSSSLIKDYTIVPKDFYSLRKDLIIITFLMIIFLSRYSEIYLLFNAILSGNFLETIVVNAIERYTTPYATSYSLFYRIGTAFLFASSFLIGSFYKVKLKENIFLLVLIFFIFFELSWTLGRQGAFFSIISFIIGLIVAHKNNLAQINFFRVMIFTSSAAVLLIGLWAIVQLGRVSESQINPLAIVLDRFSRYTFTPYAVFMSWFNEWDETLYYGAKTFASIFELFGVEVTQGFYLRYYIDNSNFTNIFTIYRGLIQDFGMIGSSLLFIFFGYFTYVSENKKLSFFEDIILKSIFLLLMFPLTSPLYSTSLFLGLTLSSLSIKLCEIQT